MLSSAQRAKLTAIRVGLSAVEVAYDSLENLISKIERVGDDEDLALSTPQINNLIQKYTALREALASAANALPTL